MDLNVWYWVVASLYLTIGLFVVIHVTGKDYYGDGKWGWRFFFESLFDRWYNPFVLVITVIFWVFILCYIEVEVRIKEHRRNKKRSL